MQGIVSGLCYYDAELLFLGSRVTVLGSDIYHGRPGSTKCKCFEMLDIFKM